MKDNTDDTVENAVGVEQKNTFIVGFLSLMENFCKHIFLEIYSFVSNTKRKASVMTEASRTTD